MTTWIRFGAVGIGETGLDYFRDLSPREDQQRAFRLQIRLARTLDLPLIIHNRDALDDVLAIMDDEGASEVGTAVAASTLTTVAVFLPVVFIEEEAGQLFRDIAIAVVAAVSLSLLVSVSVIPMFANKLLASAAKKPIRATRQLREAAKVVQLDLLDHVDQGELGGAADVDRQAAAAAGQTIDATLFFVDDWLDNPAFKGPCE